MKYIIPILFVMFLFNTSLANENNSGTEVIAEAEEIRKNGDWYLYVEDAYAISKETGKPIMANFTGSDWCGWCIRLKNEVFKTDAFKAWAEESVVLLELDYPRKKQLPEPLRAQNASLQQAFRVSGYPTLWIFNLDFDESIKQFKIAALGKTGYVAGGPDAWIAQSNLILKNNQPAVQSPVKVEVDLPAPPAVKEVKPALKEEATVNEPEKEKLGKEEQAAMNKAEKKLKKAAKKEAKKLKKEAKKKAEELKSAE